ncbi:MAG: hypothetical protein PWP64_1057 [Candidatus Cloacimonadota bacterium]|nr:hypothetical protein [Candidatus Cloacimonadota bacterium]
MKNDDLMIRFVGILQERYPDIIFRFEYQEEDDWYKIWHTYENVNEDDEFRDTIGGFMKDILFPEGMMKVYFDLNIDFIEGMKCQPSWHVVSTKDPSVKDLVTFLQTSAANASFSEKKGNWSKKPEICQQHDDEHSDYQDAA